MSRYEPSPDALVAHLEGEAVLLHMGTKHYFRLNGTGAHVWKGLESGASDAAIAASLVETFEVSLPDATTAMTALLAELLESNLVRLREP